MYIYIYIMILYMYIIYKWQTAKQPIVFFCSPWRGETCLGSKVCHLTLATRRCAGAFADGNGWDDRSRQICDFLGKS